MTQTRQNKPGAGEANDLSAGFECVHALAPMMAKAGASRGPAGKAKRAVGSKRKKVPPPLGTNQHKKKRLAEALRAAGLDEGKVAEAYVVVVKKLRTGNSDENATIKLLVDVLKECCRILEPPGAQGSRASEGPAVVNLYHNVPRPVRGFRRGSADAEAEEEAQ